MITIDSYLVRLVYLPGEKMPTEYYFAGTYENGKMKFTQNVKRALPLNQETCEALLPVINRTRRRHKCHIYNFKKGYRIGDTNDEI